MERGRLLGALLARLPFPVGQLFEEEEEEEKEQVLLSD